MDAETLKYYKHPKMQEKFREAMGELQPGDWWISLDGYKTLTTNGNAEFANRYEHIRLPLPIDPRNPERGLWGMMDNCSAKLRFEPWRLDKSKWSFTWHSIEEGTFHKYGETPELALLKALAFQWGVEVKEDDAKK